MGKRLVFWGAAFLCGLVAIAPVWGQALSVKAKGKKSATKTAQTKQLTFDYDARYIRDDSDDTQEEHAKVVQLSGIPNVSSFVGILEFHEVPKDKRERLAQLVKVQSNGIKGLNMGPIKDVKFKYASGIGQEFSWTEPGLGKSSMTYYLLESKGVIFGVRHMCFEDSEKPAKQALQGILDSIRAK